MVILLASLAGCTGTVPGTEPPQAASTGVVVLEIVGTDQGPVAFLWSDRERQRGTRGSYCWSGGNLRGCVDTPGSLPPEAFTPVAAGTPLRLLGDFSGASVSKGLPPRREFGPLRRAAPVELAGRMGVLEGDPGRYVLEVFADWNGETLSGDAVFTFGIEIAD
jgi:hypothetical protein